MKGLNRVEELNAREEAIREDMYELLAESVKGLTAFQRSVVSATINRVNVIYYERAIPEVISAVSNSERTDDIERKYSNMRDFDFNARNEFDFEKSKEIEANKPKPVRSSRRGRLSGE